MSSFLLVFSKSMWWYPSSSLLMLIVGIINEEKIIILTCPYSIQVLNYLRIKHPSFHPFISIFLCMKGVVYSVHSGTDRSDTLSLVAVV